MSENPYLSPSEATPSATVGLTDSGESSLQDIARQTFLVWEKLHVVYVAVLALVTLLLIVTTGSLDRRVLRVVIEGAVVANIAYFAGPLMETYIHWLGYDRRWPRWVMFTGGTLLAIILAVGVLATQWLPDQN